MADKKISALTGASTPLAGTEVLPIVQGGATVKVSVDNLTAGKSVAMKDLTIESTSGSALLSVTRTGIAGLVIAADGSGPLIWPTTVDNIQIYNKAITTQMFAINTANGTFVNQAGNYVPATAGKGINFTANTPAAGMTSQLLNWYEEGTWTPTVTSTVGALSGVTATGTYTRIGRQIYVAYNILISANGTGATAIKAAGLPFTIANNRPYGVGNETDAVGFNTISQGIVGTDYAIILTFAGLYPGGSGYRLQGDFSYTV